MTTAELTRRLDAAGVDPAAYDIGRRSYDGVCLLFNGQQWVVFYSERGRDQAPLFSSPDESLACEYYLDFVLAQQQLPTLPLSDEATTTPGCWSRLRRWLR